jgi:hypothetical protein
MALWATTFLGGSYVSYVRFGMKNVIKALATSLPMACALLLSGGAAKAEIAGRCSIGNGAGSWGYTVSGQSTSLGSDAIVGAGTVDATGRVYLNLTEVSDNVLYKGRLVGEVKVNPDCTGTLVVEVFEAQPSNPPSHAPKVATATWELVYVDNQREILGLLTNLKPEGGTLPKLPIQTLNAKRIFPGR